MLLRFVLLFLYVGALMSTAIAAVTPEASPATAQKYFDEANRQCQADHGHLWGKTLCGPKLLVVPTTRHVITNQADQQGKLHADGSLFVGQLPPEEAVANSPLKWAGVQWSEMLWPLPDDALDRRTLMAHEAFHRIQDNLGLPATDGDNGHMDTLDGRYTMQLEWRALDAALSAKTDSDRRARISDALAFRAARYQQFPAAEKGETALERNEGLAEYTGVMVGNNSAVNRLTVAHRDLMIHAQDAGLTRSFAYATGPAYGLLLDRYRQGWRREIIKGGSPASLLAASLGFKMQADKKIESRATRYDGAALMKSECMREEAHTKRVAMYTATLVKGSVLQLALKHMKVQFNPSNLVALGNHGTVYPTMRLSDDWGILDVNGGALMNSNWSQVSVAIPLGWKRGSKLQGDGWTLQLTAGWQAVAGTRPGDWTVQKNSQK